MIVKNKIYRPEDGDFDEVNDYFDNLDYYQRWTRTVWTNSHSHDDQLTHALFGLATEVGEVIDPFKKERYTPHRKVTVDREHLVEELGDVLYYLVRVADLNDIGMVEVLDRNIDKLESRYGNRSNDGAESSARG
jgi:NTP pyrophosphatase (non-canonical NTP hydrolase)